MVKEKPIEASEGTDSSTSEVIDDVKRGGMDFSSCVSDVEKLFSDGKPISAVTLSRSILEYHSYYAKGKASTLKLEETTTKQKWKVSEWLNAVQELFDPDRIRKLSKSTATPVLHGRLLIIGLNLLEPQLYTQFQTDNIFDTIIEEIEEKPFEEILTDYGRKRFDEVKHLNYTSVPTQPDDPLRRIQEDDLGRAAFARFLARRIEEVPRESGAYCIHVYGPWGSGKSTLLNFIRDELEGPRRKKIKRNLKTGIKRISRVRRLKAWLRNRRKKGKKEKIWIVTEFNAWRNQHIRPPWWSLMESIFQQSKHELSWGERMKEYWWRFNTGRTHYIFGFIVLVWIVALFVFPAISRSSEGTLTSWGAAADSISKIIAIIVTLWGIVIAFSRSLLFGSSKGAKTYMELTHDPMNNIRKCFAKLMERIKPKRLVVFIDDLDRCQSDYVIELLEGIQTLFKNSPVIFVIAADRKWLNACYEENYPQLKPFVCEPGKSLGTLFLEKIFQFATPVPGIHQKLKEEYWLKLIEMEDNEQETKITLEEARKRAQKEMQTTNTEGSLLHKIDESRQKSENERIAFREEAIVRLAAPDVMKRTEHALRLYADLLDQNPRSMKRTVNTYSVNRALAILSDTEVEFDALVRWTILSLRWPILAEYLEANPEKLKNFMQQEKAGLDEKYKDLCTDENIKKVLKEGPAKQALNEEIVNQCARLWC